MAEREERLFCLGNIRVHLGWTYSDGEDFFAMERWDTVDLPPHAMGRMNRRKFGYG